MTDITCTHPSWVSEGGGKESCALCGAIGQEFRYFQPDDAPSRLAAREATHAAHAGGVEIPPEIAKIIEHLHTQDNRITDNPLFAVRQQRRIGGLEDGYGDGFAWIADGCEVDAEEAARLDALFEAGEPIPSDCRRIGFIDQWEFVTGCFTEQGCKDYIARNGHNLKEPSIYAYGSYRNAEFIALRKWLMSLRGLAAIDAALGKQGAA